MTRHNNEGVGGVWYGVPFTFLFFFLLTFALLLSESVHITLHFSFAMHDLFGSLLVQHFPTLPDPWHTLSIPALFRAVEVGCCKQADGQIGGSDGSKRANKEKRRDSALIGVDCC